MKALSITGKSKSQAPSGRERWTSIEQLVDYASSSSPITFNSASDADLLEDNLVREGSINHWSSLDYQLRDDEMDILVSMVNQIAWTLQRPVILIPGWRLPGFVQRVLGLFQANQFHIFPKEVSLLYFNVKLQSVNDMHN